MKETTLLSLFISRNIALIFLLFAFLFVSIPMYYHFFDRGYQVIHLDKLANREQSFSSRNVEVSGRLLADKAILETESQNGEEKYRRYIVPIVKPDYNPNDPVYCFIEREFRQWEPEKNENDKVQQLLSLGKDSIVIIKGVAMNFLHESLINGLSEESSSYFKSKYGLNIANNPLLIQVDHRFSPGGLIFMTSFQLILIVWILISYFKTRKAFK